MFVFLVLIPLLFMASSGSPSIDNKIEFKENIKFHDIHNRMLTGIGGVVITPVTSASNSVVSGTGITDFYSDTTVTIFVTVKNAFGTLMTSGGDTFIVKISNLCTQINSNLCEVNGNSNTLASSINGVMTDLNNGNYTYSYTVPNAGYVSVQVYLLTKGIVSQDFYSGIDLSGSSTAHCNPASLNFDNTMTGFCIASTDNVSSKIMTSLLSPYTGPIEFDISSNDGVGIELNDEVQISYTCPSSGSNISFIVNLVQGVYYTLFAKWCNISGGYSFNLKWTYPGVIAASVPVANIGVPTKVVSSPFTVNVLPKPCGDAKKTDSEACDDWNTVSGDGCSSSCTIESGWKCSGGTVSSKDSCAEICGDEIKFNTNSSYCDDKNVINVDECSSNCEVESGYKCTGGSSNSKDTYSIFISSTEAILAKGIQIVACVVVAISGITSLLTISSPNVIYSIISQFQLLFIIVVSGTYLSNGLLNLIIGMNAALLNFNFIEIEKINFIKDAYNAISFDQTNQLLYDIGIVYGSTYLNIFKLLLNVLLIILFHLILICVSNKCKKFNKESRCRKVIDKLFKLLSFSIYVRLVIESFILICFSSFSEMYEMQFNSYPQIASFVINIAIILLLLVFYGICIWQIKKAHLVFNPQEQFYFEEFFSGLKNTSLSRINPAIFMGQRIISCALVKYFVDINLSIKLIILAVIQTIHLAYLIFVCPFEEAKNLLNECISQNVIIIFSCILPKYGYLSEWNSTVNWILIATIVSASLNLLIISIVDLGIIIIKRLRKLSKRNKKIDNYRSNRPLTIVQAKLQQSQRVVNTAHTLKSQQKKIRVTILLFLYRVP